MLLLRVLRDDLRGDRAAGALKEPFANSPSAMFSLLSVSAMVDCWRGGGRAWDETIVNTPRKARSVNTVCASSAKCLLPERHTPICHLSNGHFKTCQCRGIESRRRLFESVLQMNATVLLDSCTDATKPCRHQVSPIKSNTS
jgi:hypothetical protein